VRALDEVTGIGQRHGDQLGVGCEAKAEGLIIYGLDDVIDGKRPRGQVLDHGELPARVVDWPQEGAEGAERAGVGYGRDERG
jgi:hypothetical protein